MKILSLYSKTTLNPCNNKDISIAIGIFDGIHKGHLKILNELKKNNNCTAVLSFFPHPRRKTKLIQLLRDRLTMLRVLKVDKAILLEPNDKILSMSAEQFVDKILIPLHVANIYVGQDFKLGHNRQTDAQAFKQICKQKDIVLNIVPPVLNNGVKVSSSDIRDSISKGNIEEAEFLLGRPYSLTGRIVKGRCIAKKLGFKTANIHPCSKLIVPANGVYITKTLIEGIAHNSFTYIGTSPTLTSSSEVVVETHILNFDKNLYGKKIEIIFIKKIRDEIKFNSVEELVAAIQNDISLS